MPWLEAVPPPGAMPARYTAGANVFGYSWGEYEMEAARDQRANSAREREHWTDLQKQAGKDRDLARFCKEMARKHLAEFRALDAVVKWLEGDPDYRGWRATRISEDMAPHVDRAFTTLMHS